MISSPLLRVSLQPKLFSWLKQTRNVRPTIKIAKDKFQICLDVHQFTKDEIRVKARPEHVIIEGKQERKSKKGHVVRQFVRKFKLPEGCNPQTIQSQLSSEGILTIVAPRQYCETNVPCETLVPITHSVSKKDCDESIIKVEMTDAKPSNNKS